MKNFIITESEKKQILSLYNLNKKVINEQWSAIEALFGKNLAKNMSANMSDDIVRSIETKSGNILKNSEVIFEKGGQLYLKSASGSEVSTKLIADALDSVVTGKLSKDAVLQYFPRSLKDGTEFRSFFDSALMNVSKKASIKLGPIAQQFKQTYSNAGWVQTHVQKGNMSGWKFHVFSANLDDASFLYERLKPVVEKWGAGMKIGGGDMYLRSIGTAGSKQYGKGTTIYVPSSVFSKNAQREFLSDIESAISNYKSGGSISGDRMINNKIGYRYELSKPVDPAKGVTDSEYRLLYNANQGGEHKPNNVKDMFQ